MTFDNPILFFLCALGVFNGFLASLYLLFFSKHKLIQNRFLGFLILMLSLRIGKSVYALFSSEWNLDIMQVGLSACFLIGVFLFYYIKTSIENSIKLSKTWLLHISILVLVIVGVGLFRPYEEYRVFWRDFVAPSIYFVWGAYLIMTGYLLLPIFKKLFKTNHKTTTPEVWLIAVFTGNMLIYIAYLVGWFFLYMVGTLTFSFVFYVLLFFLLFQKNRQAIFQDIPQKYQSKKIEATEARTLQNAIDALMEKEELYKNTNIKLKDVADKLGVSTHKLSQFLNDNLQKSFSTYINECRVEEAKKLLMRNTSFTFEAIGFESGFSSKSTFYSAFKKVTGKTPSQFLNQ